MKIAAFISTYNYPELLKKMKTKNMGLFLVEDGVYHATLKEKEKPSDLLSIKGKLFALIEDVRTRGFSEENIDNKVTPISFEGLVDLIMKEYEKLVWI